MRPHLLQLRSTREVIYSFMVGNTFAAFEYSSSQNRLRVTVDMLHLEDRIETAILMATRRLSKRRSPESRTWLCISQPPGISPS